MATKKIQWNQWNSASQANDILHPETECAQIVDLAAQLATKADKSIYGTPVSLSLWNGATAHGSSNIYMAETLPNGKIRVTVRMDVTGISALDTSFAALPVGLRPTAYFGFAARGTGGVFYPVVIQTDGGITIQSTGFGSTYTSDKYIAFCISFLI